MGQCVVIATEQTEVGDDGLAAIGPGDDVVARRTNVVSECIPARCSDDSGR